MFYNGRYTTIRSLMNCYIFLYRSDYIFILIIGYRPLPLPIACNVLSQGNSR
nr:MAG TPA: hypothetical protein [Caudoviricetes sp.]